MWRVAREWEHGPAAWAQVGLRVFFCRQALGILRCGVDVPTGGRCPTRSSAAGRWDNVNHDPAPSPSAPTEADAGDSEKRWREISVENRSVGPGVEKPLRFLRDVHNP